MRLLLVEDKKELCEALKKLFYRNNIDLDFSLDGEEGAELALSGDYSVIILDIMLPSISGVEILKSLRSHSMPVPVIMLTARETVEDKVGALDCGADDYLVKPFEFEELLARVRALARRAPILLEERISVGNTSIDRKTLEVSMSGRPVKTSVRESKLLERLFLGGGNFVTKESILMILSGKNKDISSNNVEVYIHYLRKKFPPESSGFIIETKQSQGYRIVRTR